MNAGFIGGGFSFHTRSFFWCHSFLALMLVMPSGMRHVASGVEFLRVQALPPLALAIGLRQLRGVVAHAGLWPFGVVSIGHLKPVPRVSQWLLTPKRSPLARATLAHVPTMSFFGPTLTEFQA